MKNKKDIFIIIAIFFIVSSTILTNYLGDLDEIWNYNFARNVLEGRVPYQDFNMIQTPLLPFISAFFLKIFGNELIIMKLLAIFLCSAIFFVTYKILEKRLNINSYVSLMMTMFILFLFKDHVRIDYNFVVLLIVLFLIYLELKPQKEIIESNPKRDLLIGILAGSTILFKQTTGIVITVVTIGYKLLLVENKEELKKWIKLAFIRMLGAMIPVFVLLLYIGLSGIWKDFVSYTILGVKTFSNSLPYTYLFQSDKWMIKGLAIVLPIMLLVQYFLGVVKNNKTETNRNFFVLFCYSIASGVVIFPITDEIHFLVGMLPCIIATLYFSYTVLQKWFKGKIRTFTKIFIQCASIGILVYWIILSIQPLATYAQNVASYTELEHFSYIPISEGLKSQIQLVDQYIEESEEEVYILDATASVYQIPINQYNKNYDMFLKGNLGKEGEKGIIEELKKKENSKVLIMKEGLSRNWQNPEEVRKYIQENWKKTDEIACFEVYER